ncbi:MAG: TolC family protein [Oscillospiraceae bacterium]|nr:TolC family protein [Oscillospiraceae bacterium]
MKKRILRLFSLVMCMVFAGSLLTITVQNNYSLPEKTFSLAQAQSLALANSDEIQKTYNQILLKKMKYTESVKGIQAKAKNKRTLRWTPLLSFKLPEKLNLIEEFELVMKPLALTSEITTLQRKMSDQRFDVLNDVSNSFFKVYILQEKVSFKEEVLELSRLELERNVARFAVGLANQNDIDTMEKSVDKLAEEIAQLKRNFQSEKEALGDIVSLDLTTGYRFLPPLQTAEISREHLEDIIEFTLNNDQTVYEARIAESMARMNLDQYEVLMKEQYGSKMNPIGPFVNAAKNGMSIDFAAFQLKYDEMTKTFDEPWDKKYRILFITFSKEFLKGQISGTRYIEDEIYALYTACMELDTARKERESAEKDLTNQVKSDYEALVTAKNAAFSMIKTQEDTRVQLERVLSLNKIGKAEYDEVKEKQDDYQAIQIEAMDAMGSYNELLMNFDRLTCGAITSLLKGTSLTTDAMGDGLSLPGKDVYYYIYNDISDLTFVFGIDVPVGFEPNITHYEIWYEGVQIGERTEADKRIRHLTLVNGDSDDLTVRVFDGDTFVAECVIDTTTPRDVLPIPKAELSGDEEVERKVGTYKISTDVTGEVSISKIMLEFDVSANAGFYKIVYGENDVYSSALIPAADSFTYLSLLITGLDDVKIMVYDKDEGFVGEARFNTENQTIMLKTESPG